MTMKSGQRLKSAVCDAQFIIIRAQVDSGEVLCGGAPVIPADSATPSVYADASPGPGSLLGKRYENEESTLELLCTKSGVGTLSLDGKPLRIKAAKSLPSSD